MLNRLDLRGLSRETGLTDQLPRPNILGDDGVQSPGRIVSDIIAEVRERGDARLRELTAQFDGVELEQLAVPREEIEAAWEVLDPVLRTAMEASAEGIERFHQHQVRPPERIETEGMTIVASQKPVQRAGLYVPGGRAAYPSTVLMTAVPARVAGVPEIVLCVPPNRDDGGVVPSVLAAARLAGVSQVFAIGGAQAIAAMAYGTESVPAVDVIAGPGNVYVAVAKQQVAGDVGIAAAFAGPSEVVVVADGTAEPEFAAVDIILQAEHGPDGLAWLVTWDEAAADAICAAGDRLLANAPRAAEVRANLAEGGYVALVDGPEQALAVVDAIAPEHLELQCVDAQDLAQRVNNAGAIFCGPWAPASLGDYIAGPSHVLPTFGSARFSSALTVADFVKDHHVITVDERGLSQMGPHTVALANEEGLAAHAQSVTLRLHRLAGAGGTVEPEAGIRS